MLSAAPAQKIKTVLTEFNYLRVLEGNSPAGCDAVFFAIDVIVSGWNLPL
jgi:hypothetical protein